MLAHELLQPRILLLEQLDVAIANAVTLTERVNLVLKEAFVSVELDLARD